MCFEYDETPEFTTMRVSKARKQHRCSVCRRAIVPGEVYGYYSGKFDGEFSTDHVCRRCEYDIVRIVEHELAEGCRWSEAWPAFCDVAEYLENSGLGRTPFDAVPATFKVGDRPKQPQTSKAD